MKEWMKNWSPYAKKMLVFIGAFVFLGLVLMLSLWSYAAKYEASRPANTMSSYAAGLNERLRDGSLLRELVALPHEAQSDEEVEAAAKELLAGGISYTRITGSATSGLVEYALKCGNYSIGSVTLVEDSNSKARPGMRPWVVYRESFSASNFYNSVEVTVPKGYTVSLNGYELGSEYAVEEVHYQILESCYAQYDEIPKLVKYRFDHAVGELKIRVTTPGGTDFAYNPEDGEEQFYLKCTEAELTRLKDFAKRFARRYLTFTTGINDPVAEYDRIALYIKSGSDLEKRLKMAIDGLTWAHTTSLTIDSVRLNSVVSFGDSSWLCDVTIKATTDGPNGIVQETSNMMLLVKDYNGDMRVCALDMY